MISRFICPNCEQPLEKELHPMKHTESMEASIPASLQKNILDNAPSPYVQLFCASSQCLGTVANENGGSGPTEEAAYRSLCLAVDNETEDMEPWEGPSTEEIKDRSADKAADHDRKRAIGL